jgi:hypothetical protein
MHCPSPSLHLKLHQAKERAIGFYSPLPGFNNTRGTANLKLASTIPHHPIIALPWNYFVKKILEQNELFLDGYFTVQLFRKRVQNQQEY